MPRFPFVPLLALFAALAAWAAPDAPPVPQTATHVIDRDKDGPTGPADGKDNDCDSKTDEPDAYDAKTWYADRDGDNFGAKLASTRSCNQPNGYVADATDCNDTAASAHPGGTEVCDGRDNDCNGKADEPE